jgi:hypothetical protein
MVRLASIQHEGKAKLVAELSSGGFCDLSSVADNARDFFVVGGLDRAKELIAQALSSPASSPNYIPVDSSYRRLAPIDGSLVGKFLCIGMNYKVR